MKFESTKAYAEIGRQATAWEEALAVVQKARPALASFWLGKDQAEVLFNGCGTSYYLAISAAATYQLVTGRPARATASSEVFLFPGAVLRPRGTQVLIPISRSGDTTETVRAAEHFKALNSGGVVALTCNPQSRLAQSGDVTLAAPGSFDQSLVMTSSFSSMLLMAEAVATLVGGQNQLGEELARVPAVGRRVIPRSETLAREVAGRDYRTLVFLGAGPFYGLAREGTLKVKEMAYAWSEAYNPLEFRHGPKAIVDAETLVVMLVSESARRFETPLIEELKGYGATVLAVAEEAGAGLAAADHLLELRSGLSELARLVLYAPVLQYLGGFIAARRGLDPDHPRNLANVVQFGGAFK